MLEADIEWLVKHSDSPPTKADITKHLCVPESDVNAAVHRLENMHKIMVDNHGCLIWVAVDNPKLRALVDSSTELV